MNEQREPGTIPPHEPKGTGLMRVSRILPILDWLPRYPWSTFGQDAAAGLTTAVMLVPQGMAYAMLAGLPPVVGLYASMVPLLAYAIFGTSRQLAVGPVAMVSLIVASGVGGLTSTGSPRYLDYAVQLALLVGVFQVVMGLGRLGFLTNFLSHPVLSGFTSAAAIIIGVSQLGHFFGIKVPSSHYVHQTLWNIFTQIEKTHTHTLLIGIASVVLLLLSRRLDKRFPGALLVVVLATLAVWGLGLAERGVRVVGSIPSGVPNPTLPLLDRAGLTQLWPTALTISLVGFMESIAVAKAFARRHRYEVNANQELVGLGMANLAGSLFQAYPVTGGFSRTAVNAQAGAKSAMASLVTAAFVALTLLFLTPLFYYLPQAVLAAIIMTAVVGLIDAREVVHLWKVKRSDLVLLVITFVATLTIGIDQGILTGVGASLLWFVVRATRPHFAVLGRLPGTRVFRNRKRYPEAEALPGVLVVRMDAQFYFGNVSFLREALRRLEAEQGQPLRAVVIDGSSINQLDSSAESALSELHAEYQQRNITLYLAGLKGPVLDVMKRSGLLDKMGPSQFHFEVADAVDAIARGSSERGPASGPLGGPAPGVPQAAPVKAHAHCHVFDTAHCSCPLGDAHETAQVIEDGEVSWEPLGKLVSTMGVACIDGRHRECALGSPGGDAGELLLLLSSVEQVRAVEFDAAMVRAALVDYVTAQGRFAFHTDRSSLDALLGRLGSPPQGAVRASIDTDLVERFLRVDASERDALRPLLTVPEHIGCGHLRSMLVTPALYRVRPRLVELVIRTCVEELWEHSLPIQFSVLDGAHLERAVVTFQSCGMFDQGSVVPTPCDVGEHTRARGVYVHHGAVLDYLRARVLDLLARNSLRELDLTEIMGSLKGEVRRRACEHLSTTLDQLAPGLDRYCVRFDSQRRALEQTHRVRPVSSTQPKHG